MDNLAVSASRREMALGRSYRELRSKGPVIVLDADTVMTNITGLSFLSVESHARLWDLLLSQNWAGGPRILEGRPAPTVMEAGELPALGSWKATVGSMLDTGGAVVLRHVEDLDPHQVNAIKLLADHLQSTTPSLPRAAGDAVPVRASGRLALTADLSRCDHAVRQALSQIAVRVDLPALAHRRQEIPSLADALIQRIPPGRRPVLSAAALQSLMNWDWPGNLAELHRVVTDLARDRPGRVVSPCDLPEDVCGVSIRRTLTRIELAERAEIVAALHQAGGNRSRAAELLGIGRTTLYRRLHVWGIGRESLSE